MRKSSYSGEERFWAAASHISLFIVLSLPFGIGLLAPITIVYYKRKVSRWVTFHGLQALTAHSTVWLLRMILIQMVGSNTEDPNRIVLQLFVGITLIGIVYAVFGTLATAMSRNFRYPFIGYFIERKLGIIREQ